MNRISGFILALAVAVMTACASGGGGAPGEPDAGDAGSRPGDNEHTRSATVHLAQAATLTGADAETHYAAALQDALNSIQESPENPKGYLVAGQAAIGVGDWVQADSMFDRAEELYPPYAEQLVSEREAGWVTAYNEGAQVLNTGDLEEAIAFFEGADMLYEDRPEARMALGSLYTQMGRTEDAAQAYLGALEILSGPPPEGVDEEQAAQWEEDRRVAAMNAAQLVAQTGDYARAAEMLDEFLASNAGNLDPATELQAKTARAGFLAQAGEAEEAEAIYGELVGRTDLSSADHFQIGIGFFNTGDYEDAADAFARSAEMNPYSRDALLNLVQSLYSHALELEEQPASPERNQALVGTYDRILENAERVREFDPLNRNLLSFMLRSYRAKAELAERAEAERLRQATQDLFRSYQQQTYEVSDITLAMRSGNQVQIRGMLTNLTGQAGEQVQLRFDILGHSGETLETTDVVVAAPAEGEQAEFSATVALPAGEFAGWRYEPVP